MFRSLPLLLPKRDLGIRRGGECLIQSLSLLRRFEPCKYIVAYISPISLGHYAKPLSAGNVTKTWRQLEIPTAAKADLCLGICASLNLRTSSSSGKKLAEHIMQPQQEVGGLLYELRLFVHTAVIWDHLIWGRRGERQKPRGCPSDCCWPANPGFPTSVL